MEIKRDHIFINQGDTIYTDILIKYKNGKVFIPGKNDSLEFIVYKDGKEYIRIPIDESLKVICQTDNLSVGVYNWMVHIDAHDYDDEYIYIDAITREIETQNPNKVFGTQYDKDSMLIKFKVINAVSDVFKMSDSVIRINWKDSSNKTGTTLAVNNRIVGDSYEFDWIVPGEALKNKGQLFFVVKATKTKEGTDEIEKIWGSKLAQTLVPESIYVKISTLTQAEKDQVAEMLMLVDSKVKQANTTLENKKNEYLNELVVEGDKQVKRLADLGLYVDEEGYIVQEVENE